MSTSTSCGNVARAIRSAVQEDRLVVDLSDGRTLLVPLAWFPRLLEGTAAERRRWRLIGDGEGIHWPDLDEDISVQGLLSGCRSGESPQSLRKWLATRGRQRSGKGSTRTLPKVRRSGHPG